MDGGGRLETELPNSKRELGRYSFGNCDVTHLLPKLGNDVHIKLRTSSFFTIVLSCDSLPESHSNRNSNLISRRLFYKSMLAVLSFRQTWRHLLGKSIQNISIHLYKLKWSANQINCCSSRTLGAITSKVLNISTYLHLRHLGLSMVIQAVQSRIFGVFLQIHRVLQNYSTYTQRNNW